MAVPSQNEYPRVRSGQYPYEGLFDYAPDGLFLVGQDGRYIDVNPAGCALLGYAREELVGKDIKDLVRPEELGRIADAQANVAAGNTDSGEWEVRHKSGEWIPVEINSRLLPDGRWLGCVRDGRERKRLENSAMRLAPIVESSDDAIVSKDLTGIIKSWNSGAERVFGYTAQEVIGKSITILIPPDRLEEEPEILRRLQRGERVDHFETIRRRKDGALRNISLTISPIRNSAGKIIGASKIARDITDQKRAHEALARNEERLRFVLDNAPAFISYIDSEYRYVRVNGAYEKWFNLPAEQIRGKHIRDAFGDEYFESVREKLERARTGERVSFDAVVRRPNGELHDFAVVYTPDHDSAGTVIGFISLLQDVTERKRHENALRTREAEMRRLLHAIPDVICRFDRKLRYLYASPMVEKLTGIPPSHFTGKTHIETGMDAHLAETLRGSLSRVFQTGEPDSVECEFNSPVLGRRYLLALGIPEHGDDGAVMSVLSIIRDITERRTAELDRAALLEGEKEARQTAELLNRVAPVLAAELDPERLVQSVTDLATMVVGAEFGSFFHNVVNEAGESYMLYTLSGVQKEAFAGFPMPRNTEVFAPTFRGDGIIRSSDITKDARYGKSAPHYGMPEGHLPVRSYLAAPVLSRSGEVLGGLFFGHSEPGRFTDRHEALLSGIAAQAAIAMDNARLFEQAQRVQNQLKKSNEELRRANEDLETFAYSASHDLQEPLRTTALSAQLLERRTPNMSAESRKFLNGVLDGTSRMQTLVQDLLSYTRATKQAEGAPQPVSAGEVLQTLLQNMQAVIEHDNARINAADLPSVRVHEIHLTQLFQNLISNALKYRSAEDPYVHISATQRDGWAIFSVADNGIGIEPRFSEQIFGLFKRLHTRDRYPGSGIGLAICQRIVEQYGGRIWLERSEPGRGSVFSFQLPVTSEQSGR